jgi:hypothetical protein
VAFRGGNTNLGETLQNFDGVRTMLTLPRAVREISRSSLLVEQGRLAAYPTRPLEKSGVESLTTPYLAAWDELLTWLDVLFDAHLFTS